MIDLRFPSFVFASLVGTLVPARAASDFVGPKNWSPTAVTSPATTRKIMQWHISGDTSTSLTFIDDSTIAYADTIAMIAKNLSDNNIKAAVNKDMPCHGQTGHVVEFAFGPSGSRTIINRLVIPSGPGVATITYTRAEGNDFDADVKSAETAYCASS